MTDATIVCCVEAGRLEHQTMLMVASLRAFGGALAKARVLAVRARWGPALAALTLQTFEALDVELVKVKRSRVGFEWFGYSNKVRAIEYAQQASATEQIIWLDSDILVVDDLSGLMLLDREDVAVRVEPVMPSISTQDASEQEYWRSLAKIVGTDLFDVPWVDHDGLVKLAYFNSGVIVWQRRSGFAEAYTAAFQALLESRLAQSNGSFFAADQVIIAPVIAKERLRWRSLSLADHRMVFPALLESDRRSWEGSNLLHYSGSRDRERKPVFQDRLRQELPRLTEWLQDNEPPQPHMSWPERILAKALKTGRSLRWRTYAARTRNSPAGGGAVSPGSAVIRVD